MSAGSGVVDAHVHVWDLATRPQPWIDPVLMAPIARSFSPAELEAVAATADVAGMVLVQVLNVAAETTEYLRVAEISPVVEAVVGWTDLESPGLDDRLDDLAELPGGALLAGIRHQAQAEPDPAEWLGRSAVREALLVLGRRGLSFDLMLRPAQLARALAVARSVPETVLVLDHAGKPPVVDGWTSDGARTWAGLVRSLATSDNVVCKLSGLTTMADLAHWSVDDLQPFVDHLLDCFGAGRLIFGSDWPVSLRAGRYAETLTAARVLVAELSPAEQGAVLAGNARRVYRTQNRRALRG